MKDSAQLRVVAKVTISKYVGGDASSAPFEVIEQNITVTGDAAQELLSRMGGEQDVLNNSRKK